MHMGLKRGVPIVGRSVAISRPPSHFRYNCAFVKQLNSHIRINYHSVQAAVSVSRRTRRVPYCAISWRMCFHHEIAFTHPQHTDCDCARLRLHLVWFSRSSCSFSTLLFPLSNQPKLPSSSHHPSVRTTTVLYPAPPSSTTNHPAIA